MNNKSCFYFHWYRYLFCNIPSSPLHGRKSENLIKYLFNEERSIVRYSKLQQELTFATRSKLHKRSRVIIEDTSKKFQRKISSNDSCSMGFEMVDPIPILCVQVHRKLPIKPCYLYCIETLLKQTSSMWRKVSFAVLVIW